MRYSIITVCFNAKKTISLCIESVLSQDYKDFEYIIIDGSSNDGTKEILKAYGGRISKIISEPDNGIYDAMNKGLALAQGDWILFLNSDDLLYEIRTLSNAAQFLIDREKNYYGIAEVVYQGMPLYRKPNKLTPINFANELPIHQTVFISKLYKDKRFDTRCKISADSIYLYELNKESNFHFIPVCVASFSLGGASSWYPNLSKYRTHLREHIKFLSIKNSSISSKIYIIFAFTLKYLLSKILSKNIYFKFVSYVAQSKEKF